MLGENGYEAYIVHLGNFSVDWFPHKIKAIRKEKALQMMRDTDVLICPEVIPLAAAEFPCRRKVAFVQNWALAEVGTGPDRRFEDFDFTELLACSGYIRDFMKGMSSLPCSVITNGIDLDMFRTIPEKRKPCSVLFLNRRNVEDARRAISMLPVEIKAKAFFIELENKYSQQEIVEFYQEADIFMAIGYPEGFALPPLEAMACGCAVIGFTGGGGLEHMKDGKTALTVPDGDRRSLSLCLQRILTDESLKEEIRTGGISEAEKFSIRQMEKGLLSFVSGFYKNIKNVNA